MKILFLIVFLFGYNYAYSQTETDAKMGEIINSGNLFQLKRQYPLLKDSVSMRMLNLIAEAQLGIGFNRLESAATALDSLLQFHQDALGTEGAIGMAALRAMNLLNMGLYRQGGDAGKDLVNALKEKVPVESLYSFIFMERVGKALSDQPAPYLKRPAYDVVVPMRYDTAGRGKLIYIPVEVNGITKEYVFDTGCSFGNFVSEKYAEEVGLKIVADSIPVGGINIGFVKLAVADSLKVGEIIYYNPVFMIAPPDKQVDSLFTFNGILGYHFIRDIKEIIIDNKSGSFIFPCQLSNGETNMYLSSNIPNLQIEYNGKAFDLIFDTGNAKSSLGTKFAQLFPKLLSGLPEHSVRLGGFAGIYQSKTVVLPRFHFQLSGTPITLHDIDVSKESNKDQFGSLGTDFIMSFKQVTINYDSMFVRCAP